MSRDGINASSAVVEVALPLRISHAWIAFACQKAGLTRPRWDHENRVWTALPDSLLDSRNPSPIFITCPGGDRTMRVEGDAAYEEQVRGFVTAVLTGMFQRTRRGGEHARR
jgi:hypothetical protein